MILVGLFQLGFSGSMVLWLHGSTAPLFCGSMVLRFHSSVIPQFYGSMVPWQHGSVVLWFHGSMAVWLHGPVVTWFRGSILPCFQGSMIRRPLSPARSLLFHPALRSSSGLSSLRQQCSQPHSARWVKCSGQMSTAPWCSVFGPLL